MRVLVILIVSLWSAIICQAAPQEAPAAPADDASADGAADDAEVAEVDLTEAKDLMAFLKMMVKMPIEMIIQERLFQPKALLEQTVQDTMTDVLKVRKDILDRIKEIRAGTIEVNTQLSLGQEAFLNGLRMDVMEVLLMLVEKEANTLEALQKVGKRLLEVRAKIVDKVMMLIMLRDGTGRPPGLNEVCECEPYRALVGTKEAPGTIAAVTLKELADGKAILIALNMELMNVDNLVKMKYTSILAATDDEKRMTEKEELDGLKVVSNCLNDVMIDVSSEVAKEEPALDKVHRTLDKKLESCRSTAKRELSACEGKPQCSPRCDSCGADQIDEILDKLQTWSALLEGDGDESRKEDIRDEALSFLNKLDGDMTKLLNDKINAVATEEKEKQCEEDKLKVLKKSKNPMWMLVNVTIFGDDNLVKEMITALIQAKTEMRQEFCTDVPSDTGDTSSCDVDEIKRAKEWTTTVDTLITEQIFIPDVNVQDVALEIVSIKGQMEERVRELFKDGLNCGEEVEQIKNIYSNHITKCLDEMMDLGDEFATMERHERVDCMKKLRNMIEERRGMLWMRELMKKIQDAGNANEGA